MYPEIFRKQLEELRTLNHRRYTLRAIAKRIQVSHSMLSQVLAQKKAPSLHLAKRICHELNISAHDQVIVEREVMELSQLSAKYFPTGVVRAEAGSSNPLERHVLFQKLFNTEDISNIESLTGQLRTQAFEILSLISSNEIPLNSQIVLSVERPKDQT